MELQTRGAPEGQVTLGARSDASHRATHLVIAATRYASVEPSSLEAAIRDGLTELLGPNAADVANTGEVYVYFRNRHGNTVTVEVSVPVSSSDFQGLANGEMKRRQTAPKLTLQPSRGHSGLAEAMDRAAASLGLPTRYDLPECWQTFTLPFRGYEPTSQLNVGYTRNHRRPS